MRVKFTGDCLKQTKITYTQVVNNYIAYNKKSCLFGAVTLTKNADLDRYGYSGYGIGFDRRGSFSFPGDGLGQNVLIFGVDMSSSAHIDNKKKTY